MFETELRKELAPPQIEDEATLRKRIVNRQREIEKQLPQDPKGRAVFFVGFLFAPSPVNQTSSPLPSIESCRSCTQTPN